ncbi:hypothetical protein ACFODZ_01440 [Marinicella sediminis]|uniref:Uncharacterized protein n=1 Tax=Marinicella sediminis TaxID=1792834 RepID=A0ABV7J9K1_9GAMM|nr:hypothetical protein [Marinicella sediminis]
MPEYTTDDIKVLRGLELIRNRPGMYFPTTGRGIAIYLLEQTLTSILDTKFCSQATAIELKVPSKGGLIIRYDGIGMPTELEEMHGIMHPIVYKSIMQPFFFLREPPNFIQYGHLCEIGGFLSAFCKELTLVTVKEGHEFVSSFSFGAVLTLMSKIPRKVYTANEIYILFDESILDGQPINDTDLQKVLKNIEFEKYDCKVTIS